MAKYGCPVCGYVFDPEYEYLDFEELEEEWLCPECENSKNNFVEIES